ncbi:hypothetical protein PUN28_008773 [Cardiocondyla obscurior]|uniref:Gag-pol polyprotein n=1 Tax=Cardiocondyla obscurior TaxID=286306 RepID=A0AAW2FQB2_9HYME
MSQGIVMRDPSTFTVTTLKDKLRELNLATTGIKNELIKRLQEADPSGQWIIDLDSTEVDASEEERSETSSPSGAADDQENPPGREEMLRRENELAKRERSLMARELDVMRRENEQLRVLTQVSQNESFSASTYKISLTSLKELLPAFSGKYGTFQKWKEQLTLVKRTYQLDDGMTKLLIGAKLEGDAIEWFHSVPEHLSITLQDLLGRMEIMYDQREKKLTLRREFEKKKWNYGETFAEYYHKKVILANKVPISEEEMVDYIIEGIPDDSIRRQAMMLRFVDKEAMLHGMENISLPTEHKTQQKMEKGATKITGKITGAYKKSSGEVNVKTEVRCYNCNAEGHMANKCPMPKRERGACFKCYQMGHRAKDCPIKGRPKKEVNSVSTTREDEESDGMSNGERSEIINSVSNSEIKDFHRKVSYELVDKANDMKISLELDTLFESEYASPVVLVRKKTGDIRLCVDFRELNKLLIKDNYPLPNIEDLIDSLYNKKYFTKLDLKYGFYHIKMSKDSVKYTAFVTPLGQQYTIQIAKQSYTATRVRAVSGQY